MNDHLFERVKSSLQKQYYIMNDSWLKDCIEYYLDDHENPTQDEIITFVINQWLLSDLREISNEIGCLPTNLANQKCTTLKGKYILQMEKMYDISQSKYKQLEKLRNVHNENIEATENDNATTQSWEPKSKRMYQLFLTDGIQNVTAIEYKPIRNLKNNLFPGYKLLIRGPVICRRGVILLEESNIAEVGGEVESLLIVNAPENIFARALNLEENPDPYNDNNKPPQSQNTDLMDDDFEIDLQTFDQIEKQANQQNSNSKQSATGSTRSNRNQNSESIKSVDRQMLSSLPTSRTKNQITPASNHPSHTGSVTFDNKTKVQNDSQSNRSKVTTFDDDDDSFLNMIDEKVLKGISETKTSLTKEKSVSSKQSTPSNVQKQDIDEFPTEDELDNMADEYSPYFRDIQPLTKPLPSLTSLSSKPSSSKAVTKNFSNSYKSNKSPVKSAIATTSEKKETSNNNKNSSKWKLPSPLKEDINLRPHTSSVIDFPDDDFDLADVDMEEDDFKDKFRDDKKSESSGKFSQTSSKSSKSDSNKEKLISQTNKKDATDSKNLKQNTNSITSINALFAMKSEDKVDSNTKDSFKMPTSSKIEKYSTGASGVKRVASSTNSSPKKLFRSEEPPEDNDAAHSNTPLLIVDEGPVLLDIISDVKKMKVEDKDINTVVRGKVVKVIKLYLIKDGNKPYFHLDGTITDHSEDLDIVFSSEVLEKVIGYSPQEFTRKRKQSKNDPTIKDQLREDLKKAQAILKTMDKLMQLKLKKNKKAVVVRIGEMSKEDKERLEMKMKLL